MWWAPLLLLSPGACPSGTTDCGSPACAGYFLGGPGSGCDPACRAFSDPDMMFSPRVGVTVDVTVRAEGGEMVASGSATGYLRLDVGALTTLSGEPLTSVPISANPGTDALESAGPITTTVEYRRAGTTAISESALLRWNSIAACYTGHSVPAGAYSREAFDDFWGVALWAPGVEPGPASRHPDPGNHAYGDCPAPGTLRDSPGGVALRACFGADPGECRDRTVCAADEFEVSPGTAGTDRVCSAVSFCPGGTESSPPTASTNRVCAEAVPCSTGEAGPGCAEAVPCVPGGEISAGPALQPRCVPASPECGDGEYQTVPPTLQADRRCAAVTESCPLPGPGAGFYESASPTATSDRVCAAASPCGPSEVEMVPPGVGRDRRCGPAPPSPSPAPEPRPDPPGSLLAVIWNGVVFVGSVVYTAVANTREVGAASGRL